MTKEINVIQEESILDHEELKKIYAGDSPTDVNVEVGGRGGE